MFENRLKELRTERNLNMRQTAQQLGIPYTTYVGYEKNEREPNSEVLICLADFFNCSVDYLIGRSDTRIDEALLDKVSVIDDDLLQKYGNVYEAQMAQRTRNSKYKSPTVTDDTVTFPVIGEIAAGYDEIAVEDWSGETVEIPTSYLKGRQRSDFFVLKVSGESMFPTYQDGDKVLILKQTTLNYSGQVGAILYGDDCATLKKVEYVMGEDWMNLVPINTAFPPKRIENEDLEHCRVLGIPKLLIREIK